MDKRQMELYTDYLLCNYGYATATELSSMVHGEVSHDKVTRFLSEREYTSKDLWLEVKSAVRKIEGEDGVLIFDDTISEKMWTDENEIVCWHYDHTKGRTVKGINRKRSISRTSVLSIALDERPRIVTIQYSDRRCPGMSGWQRRGKCRCDQVMRPAAFAC